MGVLVLQLPLLTLAERLTEGIGGLLLLIPLLTLRFVDGIASGSFADHHPGLVWALSLLSYVASYSVVALPTHFVLRDRRPLHDIALGIAGLLFLVVISFAFPVSGLPI